MNGTRSLSNAELESRRIPRVVLGDLVREFIGEAVLSGESGPGDRIVESPMVRQLGMSHAPVCEAIRDFVLFALAERTIRGNSRLAFGRRSSGCR